MAREVSATGETAQSTTPRFQRQIETLARRRVQWQNQSSSSRGRQSPLGTLAGFSSDMGNVATPGAAGPNCSGQSTRNDGPDRKGN